MYSLYTHNTPQHFIEVATSFLELNELDNNLILGLVAGLPDKTIVRSDWKFLTVIDGDKVVAASIKMGPKVIVTALPGDDTPVELLSRYYTYHQVPVPSVFGTRDVARSFATHMGLKQTDYREMMVYKLSALNTVPLSEGSFAVAVMENIETITDCIYAFEKEIFGTSAKIRENVRQETATRIERSLIYNWLDTDGHVTSVAAIVRSTAHIGVIGYVYTPPLYRGKGYGTSLVWSLSRQLMRQGYRHCGLFAERQNQTSNSIYQKIGYEQGTIFADIYLA